jgi:hypothetical protein
VRSATNHKKWVIPDKFYPSHSGFLPFFVLKVENIIGIYISVRSTTADIYRIPAVGGNYIFLMVLAEYSTFENGYESAGERRRVKV